MPTTPEATVEELDVREIRKPARHPVIFDRYRKLAVDGSFVLVNDHDPKHLREEFEAELPGSYDWDYESTEPGDWRVRITKRTSTPLPRILGDTAALAADTGEPDVAGAVWKLQVADRELDSNVIALPPGGTIEPHVGPDLDVLIHVIAGGGTLHTEQGDVDLRPGVLLWMPRRSRRNFVADDQGLRYLTVHRRRESLLIGSGAPS